MITISHSSIIRIKTMLIVAIIVKVMLWCDHIAIYTFGGFLSMLLVVIILLSIRSERIEKAKHINPSTKIVAAMQLFSDEFEYRLYYKTYRRWLFLNIYDWKFSVMEYDHFGIHSYPEIEARLLQRHNQLMADIQIERKIVKTKPQPFQ